MNTTPPTAHALGQSPAFPVPAFTPDQKHDTYSSAGFTNTHQSGLTLRQYYKAAALQGVLSNSALCDVKGAEWVGQYAAECADTLLAEDAAHAVREGKT